MSTENEYGYKLFYQPSEKLKITICRASSIEELKNAARKDSKKNGRPPELYFYMYVSVCPLFNREEVRQCDIYNLLNEEEDIIL